MGLDKIAQIITVQDVLLAYIVVSCIACAETVFIVELAKRVGGLRTLLIMAADKSQKRSHKTSNNGDETANSVKE